MSKIDPKNQAAQLAYRARGNPPSTVPRSAISNCFPGLEFDLRNLWRRLFAGIELHEAQPLVVRVDEDAPPEVQAVAGQLLVSVDGEDIWVALTGPQVPGGPSTSLGGTNLEWSNALAGVAGRAGERLECRFFDPQTQEITALDLEVRSVFQRDSGVADADAEAPPRQSPALTRDLAAPGELTQSLCSPWQNDYLECACYYWAASRPDFVNARQEGSRTVGHNWLHRDRDANPPAGYSLRRGDLVDYTDLFQDWEGHLRFIVQGDDSE